jgi:hypothetical protein
MKQVNTIRIFKLSGSSPGRQQTPLRAGSCRPRTHCNPTFFQRVKTSIGQDRTDLLPVWHPVIFQTLRVLAEGEKAGEWKLFGWVAHTLSRALTHCRPIPAKGISMNKSRTEDPSSWCPANLTFVHFKVFGEGGQNEYAYHANGDVKQLSLCKNGCRRRLGPLQLHPRTSWSFGIFGNGLYNACRARRLGPVEGSQPLFGVSTAGWACRNRLRELGKSSGPRRIFVARKETGLQTLFLRILSARHRARVEIF